MEFGDAKRLDRIGTTLEAIEKLLQTIAQQGATLVSTQATTLSLLQAAQAAVDAASSAIVTLANNFAAFVQATETALLNAGVTAEQAAPILADLNTQASNLTAAAAQITAGQQSLSAAVAPAAAGTPAA